jgi:hypothetical protein
LSLSFACATRPTNGQLPQPPVPKDKDLSSLHSTGSRPDTTPKFQNERTHVNVLTCYRCLTVHHFHERKWTFDPSSILPRVKKNGGLLYSLLICTVTISKLLLVDKYIYFPAPLNKAASRKSRRHRAKVPVYKHPRDAKWTDPPTTGRCRRSRPLNSQSPGFQIGKQQRAADSRWPLLHTSYLPQNEQPQEEKMPRG